MATQQEVIKAFMASLDKTNLQGEKALDEAIKACSTFNGFENDLKTALINDCKNNPDDFLKTYCGIDLDNEDTGAITGYDAGGSEVKTAESIVPEEGSIENFTGDSFSLESGLTIQLASFKDDIYNENVQLIRSNEFKNEFERVFKSTTEPIFKQLIAQINSSIGKHTIYESEVLKQQITPIQIISDHNDIKYYLKHKNQLIMVKSFKS